MLQKIIEIRNDLKTGLDNDDLIAIEFAINKLDTFIFYHKKALNIDSVIHCPICNNATTVIKNNHTCTDENCGFAWGCE